ncbi:endo-1,4-beta-xylanase [Duganella sp. 1224]|uniref:endo-1,4-beta-xylanase n=1 Tax=Duganella sp. 1224 TaxID=2587052 RepID=UPI0015CBC35C|nr:endo-1,4-beta-xylanase [Duganella sp. 1224]NYE59528.1 endo-1,4-beta-xylanase [Duganella sp. 1224]
MKISRRGVLAVMAAGGLLPLHAADMPEPLKVLGKRKGLNVGNAIGGRWFRDPAYKALMARECNMLVAENEGKWQALEPRPGVYQFGPADEMYAWARSQGMLVRGHNLIWQDAKWLPKWVNEYDFGAQPAVAAEALLRKHIVTVCEHFGDGIHSYDVVNEAVDPKTGELRANVFTQRLGAVEQIDLAFRVAREKAPKAQLVYNDYMRADLGSAKHRAGVLKLLHDLKSRGTPVDALGLQSHIGSWDEMGMGRHQEAWRRFLDEVTGMGLDLLVTEFDVNDRKLPADVAVRDAGVATLAKEYLDVTFSYRQCKDFLMWGMADNASWLQGWDEAPRTDGLKMRPTPFDDQLRAKPLRDAIAAAIQGMPARG